MSRARMDEQLSQLQSPVDRLWWLAQMERGIEMADINREPEIGSKKVLNRIAAENEPLDRRSMFTMQWEAAELNIIREETPITEVLE